MQPQQPPPPFGQQPQPSPWGVGGYDGGYGQAQAQQGSYPVHPFPYGQQVPLPPYPQPGQMYMSQMGGTLNGMPMGVAPISGPNSLNGQRSTGGTLGVAPLQQPAAGGQIGGPSTASGDVLTGMLASGAMQSAYGTFQRGQAFFQGGLDKLSSSTMYHLFSVTPEYVRRKLLLLLTPFLSKWDFARHPEQVSGGQKFLPPRHDVNAPDLYIPFVALCTYCLLVSFIRVSNSTFKPENLYNTAWYAGFTWGLQVLLLKTVLYMLGIASLVPWLELVAYSGYMFFPLSLTVMAGTTGGSMAYYGFWAYGSACTAVFLVRTMKRIIFHEVRQYSMDRTLHNYLLLGMAVAQFPLALWLGYV